MHYHKLQLMANDPARSEDNGSTSVIHVETVDALENLLTRESKLLVDFYAEWCGPCQMMAPIVEELATESDMTIAKVDVDELPQTASEYGVQSIPAFIVFENGEPTERFVGMQEKDDLQRALE